MKIVILVAVAFLSTLAVSLADQAGYSDSLSATDVVVARIVSDIPKDMGGGSLWSFFPPSAKPVLFSRLSNLGWSDQFTELSSALVEKANGLRLDGVGLQRALEVILKSEQYAVVPVAAFQATIGGRRVWIVHLQWELKPLIKVVKTKDGPRLNYERVSGLHHIRTYAISMDTFEVVSFTTCG